MYEQFFGLKSSPFRMTPDPSVMFWTKDHREALAGLTYAVARRKGFVVLTGPAGTGKTTLLRKLLDSSPVAMQTSFVHNPTLSPSEFLELALADFDIPSMPMNKAQRLLHLERFLLSTHQEGKVAVLIVDEAHKLSADLLEELRLLANFETPKQKLLQIVLAGQPELNTILNRDDLWQLKQRIAVRLHIRPLSEAEVHQYLDLRWMKAGGVEPIPFEKSAIGLIAEWSRGIPRIVNGICDNALLCAYGAGRGTITSADIQEVTRDLHLSLGTPGETGKRNGLQAHPPRPQAIPVAASTVAAINGVGPHLVASPSDPVPASFPILERYREERPESFVGHWVQKMGIRVRRLGAK